MAGQVGGRIVHNGEATDLVVCTAVSFVARLRGLLGRSALGPTEGLWIAPCDRVHTWFMRFSIDVLMLDGGGRVLAAQRALPPWRLGSAGVAGGVALETAPGTIARLGIVRGDLLTLDDCLR
jgi:uncharacterized membrane protein (UPF0127 family)